MLKTLPASSWAVESGHIPILGYNTPMSDELGVSQRLTPAGTILFVGVGALAFCALFVASIPDGWVDLAIAALLAYSAYAWNGDRRLAAVNLVLSATMLCFGIADLAGYR